MELPEKFEVEDQVPVPGVRHLAQRINALIDYARVLDAQQRRIDVQLRLAELKLEFVAGPAGLDPNWVAYLHPDKAAEARSLLGELEAGG